MQNLKRHKDAEVRRLAQDLPFFLMQDLAPSTIRKYTLSFTKWSKWAQSKACPPIPAPIDLFSVFLVLQIRLCSSCSTFDSIIAGVAWAHKKMGLTSPTSHPLVVQLINAGHRILGKSTANRKKPLLHSHMKLLLARFSHGSLPDLQTLVLITLGFFGLFRWDELSNLKVEDVVFHPNYMVLFVEKRKNDQFREGFWGFIARTFNAFCPVALLKRFLIRGRHEESSYIFRKVCYLKQDYKLRKHRLTYSRSLELTRGQLAAIGLKSKEYGLHSMRSGGASLAAALGLSDRLIMRHRGWKSDSSKNRYISESKSSLLSVSKALIWGVTHC